MTVKKNTKSAAKRIEILRGAASAFRRHGYHGASMDAIAREVRMTKGNLYYYFRDKEEILYFCHDYSVNLLLKVLHTVEASGKSPSEKLRTLIGEFVHMIIDELHGTALTLDLGALSPPRLRKIIRKRDEFDRGLRRILEEGMEAGEFHAADAKLLSFAILGSINWIPRWFTPSGPAQSAQIAPAFADYLIRGLVKSNSR